MANGKEKILVSLIAILLLLSAYPAVVSIVKTADRAESYSGILSEENQNEKVNSNIYLKAGVFDPLKNEKPDVDEDLLLTESQGYYLVQCEGPILPEWQKILDNLDARIISYIPAFAYLVYMDSDTKEIVSQLDFVRWVGIWQPAYKIQPSLLEKTGTVKLLITVYDGEITMPKPIPRVNKEELKQLMKLDPDKAKSILSGSALVVDVSSQARGENPPENSFLSDFNPNVKTVEYKIEAMGGKVMGEADRNIADKNIIVAEIDASRIKDLAFLSQVHWIEKYVEMVPYTNFMAQASGMIPYTGETGKHPHTYGFDGNQTDWSTTIRNIKGGDFEVYGIFEDPDLTHPAFEQAIRKEYSETGAGSEHATATFGIAIASQEAGGGDAMGQAPDAHWCAFLSTDIPGAAAKMVSEGGVAMSASWGPQTPEAAGDYGSYAKAVDDAATSATGGNYKVLFFWSGGNSPVAPDSQAAAKDIMSIGGTDIKGTGIRSDDIYASGACYGYMNDKIMKPDMVFNYIGDYIYDCVPGGTYAWGTGWVGTSYSSPAGAGVGTVYVDMWNANHFGNYPTALPSAAALKALMISDGYFMDLAKASRRAQGWGEVNAKRAYELGDAHYIFDQGVALTTGQTWTTKVNALDTSTFETGLTGLRISLVWTDPSGDTAAAKSLVNDLDLKVTGSAGTYYGNRGLHTSLWNALGSGTNYWSDAGDSYDDCNNVENVFIASPSGSYEITVTAASTVSAQKFALVASGVVAGTGVPLWKDQTQFKMLKAKKTTVQVSDSNLTGTPNSNTTIETIPASRVAIYSETDKTPLNITLTETAADSNVFENSSVVIYEASEGVSYRDYYGAPHLRASDDDTITIKYRDLAPTVQDLYNNATYDSFAPLIQCVWIENMGRQQSCVRWYTSEDADTVIYMGKDATHMFEVNESGDLYGVMYAGADEMQPYGDTFLGYDTYHSVTIIGLNYSTVYQFQINATDKAGNKMVNDNNGNKFKFKTQVPQSKSILFVMDGIDANSSSPDYGIDYLDYYWTTFYLYKNNLAFDFWDHWDDGYPSISTLQPAYSGWAGKLYDLVIWDCSENNKYTLNATDQTDITAYLATADPNLWVIGTHVATDANTNGWAAWLGTGLGAVWQTSDIMSAAKWPADPDTGEKYYAGFVNNTGNNIGGVWTQPAPADWEGYYIDEITCMPIYVAGLIKDGMDSVKPSATGYGEYQWEAVTLGIPAKPAMAVVSSGTTTKNMVFQIFTFETMFQDPFFWGSEYSEGYQPELWVFNVTNYLLGTDYGGPYYAGLYDAHYNYGHSNSEPCITGYVNDTQGRGVYGMAYAVNTTDHSIVHGGAYSYTSGEYNISGLTAGESYHIYAQSFESETVWVNFRTGFTPAYYGAPTAVAATASGIGIVLQSYTLSGYVTATADGKPIDGVTVTAYWYGTDYDVLQGSATTNADGYYVITGFGAGMYDLVASKVGYYPQKIKNVGTTNNTNQENKNLSLAAAPAAEVLFVNDDSWYGYGKYTYTKDYIGKALDDLGIPYDYWFTGGDKTDIDEKPIPPSDYNGLPTASMMSGYKVVIWADAYMYMVAPGNDYALNASERTEIGALLDGTSGTDLWLEGALVGYSAYQEGAAAQNWLAKYFMGAATETLLNLDPSAGTWSGYSGAVAEGYIANGLTSDFWQTYRCWYTVTLGANYRATVKDNVNSKDVGFTGTYNVTNGVKVAFQSFYASIAWDTMDIFDNFIGNFFTFSGNSYLPSSPKNLQAQIVNDANGTVGTKGVQLSWDASATLGNPRADYYYIYRNTTPNFIPSESSKIGQVVAALPDPTIKTIIPTQGFSTFPPTGWAKTSTYADGKGWISSATTTAGGTSPEAKCEYSALGNVGIARLYAGPLNTSGCSKLNFKWKNMHDWYSATYPYWIAIQTSSDGSTWQNSTWAFAPTADMAKSTQSLTITTSDVGSTTFYASLTIGGQSYGMNGWYVDDVNLTGEIPPTGPPATTVFNDTSTAATDTTTYYYIVRAHNSKGNDTNLERVRKSSMALVLGWNLISLPLSQNADNITEQLITISGKYAQVQVYDAWDTEDRWKMYTPGGKEVFNDLTSIGSGTAVWIKMTSAGDLIYAGQEWNGRLMWLEPGWNFISYPTYKTGRTVGAVFGPYLSSYIVETVAAQGSNTLTTLGSSAVMNPGQGYWVYIHPGDFAVGRYIVI